MSRLLMVGLDAFPPDRLEEWIGNGSLPNLRRLTQSGRYGRVSSLADVYPASVWPTFFTQSDLSEHGIHHIEMWDPSARRIRPPTPDWVPVVPFWRSLAQSGTPVITMDVPFSDNATPQADAVEVIGWGMHEGLWHRSHPPRLMNEITTRNGAPEQAREAPDSGRDESEIALELPGLVADVGRRVSNIEYLATTYDWRLMLAVFSETHRAGHWFWNERGTGVPQGGLKQVATEIDRQLPRLEALLRPDDQLAVFSLHGMRPTIDADRVGQALSRYLDPALQSSQARRRDPVYLLRHRLPPDLVRTVARMLPQSLYNWAYYHLRNAGRDWSRLRYVVNPLDDIAYITINLSPGEGSEARQVYEEELLTRILGMTTPDGRTVVEKIVRPRDTFSGRRAEYLPDVVVLSVQWEIGPIIRMIDGAEHEAPRNSDRNGEHGADGFYIQMGPGIPSGAIGELITGDQLARHLCEPAGLTV